MSILDESPIPFSLQSWSFDLIDNALALESINSKLYFNCYTFYIVSTANFKMRCQINIPLLINLANRFHHKLISH